MTAYCPGPITILLIPSRGWSGLVAKLSWICHPAAKIHWLAAVVENLNPLASRITALTYPRIVHDFGNNDTGASNDDRSLFFWWRFTLFRGRLILRGWSQARIAVAGYDVASRETVPHHMLPPPSRRNLLPAPAACARSATINGARLTTCSKTIRVNFMFTLYMWLRFWICVECESGAFATQEKWRFWLVSQNEWSDVPPWVRPTYNIYSIYDTMP